MGVIIWCVMVYVVNYCIQWSETLLWVEFSIYAFSIHNVFTFIYNT